MRKGKDDWTTKISKQMSWLLRHGAEKEGVDIRPDGYVRTDDVMAVLNKKNKVTLEEVKQVVATNEKKRFQFEDGGCKFIRATQGHSMKDKIDTDALLEEIKSPEEYKTVLHGTYLKAWEIISKEGLNRMARNHIHFAPDFPKKDGVISGMRGSCDVFIQVDLERAMKDGIRFYKSSNNVILTEGEAGKGVLPPKYFSRVTDRKGNILLEQK